jgi:hypothetical protein
MAAPGPAARFRAKEVTAMFYLLNRLFRLLFRKWKARR